MNATYTLTLTTGDSSENAGSFDTEKQAKTAARALLAELFPGEKIKSKPGMIFITDLASITIATTTETTNTESTDAPTETTNTETPTETTTETTTAEPRFIQLADANNPDARFRSNYPKAIRYPDGSTFWGCDQFKLLESLRLNADKLDGFARRGNAFFIDNTRIWATSKPTIAAAAETIARAYILSLSGIEA